MMISITKMGRIYRGERKRVDLVVVDLWCTYLLDAEMDEEPRVSRDHGINDALFALFVANVVSPCRQGYRDGVCSERGQSSPEWLLFSLGNGGGGHDRRREGGSGMSLGDKTYPEGDSWWEREEKDGCSAHRGRLNGILASFSRTSEDESNSSHHLILSLQRILQAPSTAAAFVGCGLPWACHFNLSPTPPSSPRPFTLLHVYPRFLTSHTTTTLRTFIFSSFVRMDSADAQEHQPPMDSLDWQAYRNLSLQPHGFGDERMRIWSVLLVLQLYVYEHAIGPNLSM